MRLNDEESKIDNIMDNLLEDREGRQLLLSKMRALSA